MSERLGGLLNHSEIWQVQALPPWRLGCTQHTDRVEY